MDADSDPDRECLGPEDGRRAGLSVSIDTNEPPPATESSKNIESSAKPTPAFDPLISNSASDSDSESTTSSSSSPGGPPRIRRRSRHPDSKPPHPRKRTCSAPGCSKWRNYGHRNDRRVLFCAEHKEEGMVHQRLFGPRTEAGNERDAGAKSMGIDRSASDLTVDVENVRGIGWPSIKASGSASDVSAGTLQTQPARDRKSSKYCRHPGCDRWPIFGFEETPGRVYCRDHRKPRMVDKSGSLARRQKRKRQAQSAADELRIVDRDSRSKSASSGSDSESEGDSAPPSPLRSLKPSRPAWATCQHPGCPKWPTWNYPEAKGRVYCREHRKSEMVDKTTQNARSGDLPAANVKRRVGRSGSETEVPESVSRKRRRHPSKRFPSKTCSHPGCEKYPSFNYSNEKGYRYWGEHRGERDGEHEDLVQALESGRTTGRWFGFRIGSALEIEEGWTRAEVEEVEDGSGA